MATRTKERLESLLAGYGLRPRGGFAFAAGEAAPAGPSGASARSVILVGHAGGELWRHFSAWLDARSEQAENPLDTWSKTVIGNVAGEIGARAVFPSDKPFFPFQRWAMRAEGLKPSPLGVLLHPRFGPWHAYRGALLFEENFPLLPVQEQSHPCDACVSKPCLNACPVEAFSDAGFAVERCRAFVRSPAGHACRETGCIARNACPVGAEWRYSAAQQAFHQRAFSGCA